MSYYNFNSQLCFDRLFFLELTFDDLAWTVAHNSYRTCNGGALLHCDLLHCTGFPYIR